MTRLITYATPLFVLPAQVLRQSALKNGVDEVRIYTSEILNGTEFEAKNRHILSQKRGAGYWSWKPFLIQQELERMSPDDVLIYCDAGIEIIDSLAPLVDLSGSLEVPVLVSDFNRISRVWTKRDAFVLMGLDSPEYYEVAQVVSGFTLWRRTEKTMAIVEEWLHYMQDYRICTDAPDECGLPPLEGFVENRHDQSVLSLLVAKHNIPIYRDPARYGDHWKTLTEGGRAESLDWKASNSMAPSPYGTLINVHRFRNKKPGQIFWLIKRLLYWKFRR